MITVNFIEGAPKTNRILTDYAKKATRFFNFRKKNNLSKKDFLRDFEVVVRETPAATVIERYANLKRKARIEPNCQRSPEEQILIKRMFNFG